MNIRLVYFDIPAVDRTLRMSLKPALLVSYVYLDKFLEHQEEYNYRNWSLDSGAFSAHNSGTAIDLNEYIKVCKRLLKEDKTLVEVFALDVIGDHKASLRNAEIMWAAGVPAIPTYHIGEPVDALLHIAKTYPKIAIGGVANIKGTVKTKFAQACFSRVWPKMVHGFGFGSEAHILQFPFHSVDATNWELGPCAFGRWASFGNMSVRGSTQNLRAEVEHYLRLEQKAQQRWRKEMDLLSSLPGPTLRLASAVVRNTNVERLSKSLKEQK